QPHAEDRDQNADGEEDLLPEGVHLLQNAGVDHGVVERQGDLEDGQDGDDAEGLPPPVEDRGDQAERGDRERPAEGFQKHWLPNRVMGAYLPRGIRGRVSPTPHSALRNVDPESRRAPYRRYRGL